MDRNKKERELAMQRIKRAFVVLRVFFSIKEGSSVLNKGAMPDEAIKITSSFELYGLNIEEENIAIKQILKGKPQVLKLEEFVVSNNHFYTNYVLKMHKGREGAPEYKESFVILAANIKVKGLTKIAPTKEESFENPLEIEGIEIENMGKGFSIRYERSQLTRLVKVLCELGFDMQIEASVGQIICTPPPEHSHNTEAGEFVYNKNRTPEDTQVWINTITYLLEQEVLAPPDPHQK